MESPTCIICLDGPKVQNPLKLFSCGCKVSWFHSDCEQKYISHTSDSPVACPVCKRGVKYSIVYSFSPFSPSAGFYQKQLWLTIGLFGFEVFYSFYYSVYFLPFQTLAIFFMPFCIPSCRSLDYFCTKIQLKFSVQYLLFFYNLLFYDMSLFLNPTKVLHSCSVLGVFHLTLLYCIEAWCNPRSLYIHPLTPYIVKNNILYKAILELES
jgi:hypothetical protein